jgi:hypothetical protein
MALTDPVFTGPQDGRTITYGDGSSGRGSAVRHPGSSLDP